MFTFYGPQQIIYDKKKLLEWQINSLNKIINISLKDWHEIIALIQEHRECRSKENLNQSSLSSQVIYKEKKDFIILEEKLLNSPYALILYENNYYVALKNIIFHNDSSDAIRGKRHGYYMMEIPESGKLPNNDEKRILFLKAVKHDNVSPNENGLTPHEVYLKNEILTEAKTNFELEKSSTEKIIVIKNEEEGAAETFSIQNFYGISLSTFLAADSKLKDISSLKKMQIVIECLKLIYQLHEKGYIHRDISANNILLFKDNFENYHVSLIDFGYTIHVGSNDVFYIDEIGIQTPGYLQYIVKDNYDIFVKNELLHQSLKNNQENIDFSVGSDARQRFLNKIKYEEFSNEDSSEESTEKNIHASSSNIIKKYLYTFSTDTYSTVIAAQQILDTIHQTSLSAEESRLYIALSENLSNLAHVAPQNSSVIKEHHQRLGETIKELEEELYNIRSSQISIASTEDNSDSTVSLKEDLANSLLAEKKDLLEIRIAVKNIVDMYKKYIEENCYNSFFGYSFNRKHGRIGLKRAEQLEKDINKAENISEIKAAFKSCVNSYSKNAGTNNNSLIRYIAANTKVISLLNLDETTKTNSTVKSNNFAFWKSSPTKKEANKIKEHIISLSV